MHTFTLAGGASVGDTSATVHFSVPETQFCTLEWPD